MHLSYNYKQFYDDIVRMMKILEEERKLGSVFVKQLKYMIESSIDGVEYPILDSYQPDLEEIEEFKNRVIEYHKIQDLK